MGEENTNENTSGKSLFDQATAEAQKSRRSAALAEVKKHVEMIKTAEKTIAVAKQAIAKIEEDFKNGTF